MAKEETEKKDCVKKRKSRVESENRILEAALKVFSEVGYDAASIHTIAANANVNSALIIRYFGSKSGLLQAILFMGKEGISEYNCNSPAETLEAEIFRYFQSEIQIDYQHREFLRVVFMRAILDPEIQNAVEVIHKSECQVGLIQFLKPFQDRGDICKEIDLKELSAILNYHAMGFGTLIHLLQNIDRQVIENRAKLMAKILAKGLQCASTSPSKPSDLR